MLHPGKDHAPSIKLKSVELISVTLRTFIGLGKYCLIDMPTPFAVGPLPSRPGDCQMLERELIEPSSETEPGLSFLWLSASTATASSTSLKRIRIIRTRHLLILSSCLSFFKFEIFGEMPIFMLVLFIDWE
jgi:hypothetical protein